jgi:hypothetical protein
MLLTSWQRGLGLPVRGDKSSLDQILRFVFGERYLIQMKDGRSFEDRNLGMMLEIMADEFRVYNTTSLLHGGSWDIGIFPKVELLAVASNITQGIGNRKDVSLVVSTVEGWKGMLPPPTIEGVVDMVRHSVTMYSLTGDWDTYKKENLA